MRLSLFTAVVTTVTTTNFEVGVLLTLATLVKHIVEPDQLVLMTVRSHDQFNTTIYEYNDRYRGIHNERRVLFMNEADLADRGLKAKDLIDITSHFRGEERRVDKFVAVPYDIPKGNVCAYFPEANPLIPIGSVAKISNTPTSKYVVVTVVPTAVNNDVRIKAREAMMAE